MNSSSIGPPISTTNLKLLIIDLIAQHDEGVHQQSLNGYASIVDVR
jgi:hypothetical protein